jgi:DNA-binding NarL/FixJ family response regulator
MLMMINIVIADDHHLVRQGIRALLESDPNIAVTAEAENGIEALELVEKYRPDVLVLDVNMPRLDGIETAKRIQSSGLPTQVLILSMYSDESLVKKAFRNGVRGYLLKRSVTEELIEAVRATSLQSNYVSAELMEIIDFDEINQLNCIDDRDILDRLTAREREIFKLVAEGHTNSAVAFELTISIKTVEKHRASLMEKLGVYDLTGLVREAIKQGIIFLEN